MTEALIKDVEERGKENIPEKFSVAQYLTAVGREKLGLETIARIDRLEDWHPEPWMLIFPYGQVT